MHTVALCESFHKPSKVNPFRGLERASPDCAERSFGKRRSEAMPAATIRAGVSVWAAQASRSTSGAGVPGSGSALDRARPPGSTGPRPMPRRLEQPAPQHAFCYSGLLVRANRNDAALRRLFAALLLALFPLLFGAPPTHLGHDSEDAQSPIFADAVHAGEANHWEAAESVADNRCPACLIPTQPVEKASARTAWLFRTAGGALPSGDFTGLVDPGADRLHRPRAPPDS